MVASLFRLIAVLLLFTTISCGTTAKLAKGTVMLPFKVTETAIKGTGKVAMTTAKVGGKLVGVTGKASLKATDVVVREGGTAVAKGVLCTATDLSIATLKSSVRILEETPARTVLGLAIPDGSEYFKTINYAVAGARALSRVKKVAKVTYSALDATGRFLTGPYPKEIITALDSAYN
jgi:hypothetical protein